HLKAARPANWGKMPGALDRLRTARADTQPVTHDVYPYTASSTMLTSLLPPEFLNVEADTLVDRLSSSEGRDALAAALSDRDDFDRVLLATTASHRDEGVTLAELAEQDGISEIDALIEVLVREHLRVSAVMFTMHESDLELALSDEHTMVGSDGLPPGTGGKPHPRLYGTFPRVLGRYSRERAVLSLPETIRRMTALPARTFRIPDRGRVAPGYVADLVAFDPGTITDVGDYRDPIHSPRGIAW